MSLALEAVAGVSDFSIRIAVSRYGELGDLTQGERKSMVRNHGLRLLKNSPVLVIPVIFEQK